MQVGVEFADIGIVFPEYDFKTVVHEYKKVGEGVFVKGGKTEFELVFEKKFQKQVDCLFFGGSSSLVIDPYFLCIFHAL